eukprot:CAMPEP_0117619140 /NCGR_PEP_ID=MMETSP0784-20121206/86465_1 /TAXON_ID=39447 /ORGANISM="" /LENGTH=41 /DNA_ID= /DNA_START= /DNA_END= /DNA_ORIENTATION=
MAREGLCVAAVQHDPLRMFRNRRVGAVHDNVYPAAVEEAEI